MTYYPPSFVPRPFHPQVLIAVFGQKLDGGGKCGYNTHAPTPFLLYMQDLQFLEACLAGDSDVVQSLLELGVDINAKMPVCIIL